MAEQASPPSVQKVIFDTDVLIWYLRGHEKGAGSLKTWHTNDVRFHL
jgi:hypothetical protein